MGQTEKHPPSKCSCGYLQLGSISKVWFQGCECKKEIIPWTGNCLCFAHNCNEISHFKDQNLGQVEEKFSRFTSAFTFNGQMDNGSRMNAAFSDLLLLCLKRRLNCWQPLVSLLAPVRHGKVLHPRWFRLIYCRRWAQLAGVMSVVRARAENICALFNVTFSFLNCVCQPSEVLRGVFVQQSFCLRIVRRFNLIVAGPRKWTNHQKDVFNVWWKTLNKSVGSLLESEEDRSHFRKTVRLLDTRGHCGCTTHPTTPETPMRFLLHVIVTTGNHSRWNLQWIRDPDTRFVLARNSIPSTKSQICIKLFADPKRTFSFESRQTDYRHTEGDRLMDNYIERKSER